MLQSNRKQRQKGQPHPNIKLHPAHILITHHLAPYSGTIFTKKKKNNMAVLWLLFLKEILIFRLFIALRNNFRRRKCIDKHYSSSVNMVVNNVLEWNGKYF